MTLIPTEEQRALQETVRRFLADTSPMTEVRRLMETDEGYQPTVWSQLSADLGLTGITIPAGWGGIGASVTDLVLVCEEMGRALFCGPYLASAVLAANALVNAGDEPAAAEFLPALAAGEVIGTLAIAEDGGGWDETGIRLVARKAAGGWRLNGHKGYVVDGHIAGLVLVAARSAAGVSLFAVTGEAPGLRRRATPPLDQTRKLARLEFADTPARLIGPDGGAWPGLSTTLDLAAVALAAEQVGGAQHCLDSSVAYAKVRCQFGRPIGSFQAVKHKCADVFCEIDAARAAVSYAAWAATHAPDELPAVASLVKATCSETYFHAAAESIQIHGGIGFSWEHDAHLHFKRATASALLLGSPTHHRQLLATRIGV